MTLRATQGQPEPCRADSVHSINNDLAAILLDVHPALSIQERVSMKPRGYTLFDGSLRQQITRELVARESVERLVAVDGVNHPVSPPPRVRPIEILLVTIRIRVARQIQPVTGPLFSKPR